MSSPLSRRFEKARKAAGAAVVDNFFRGIAHLPRLIPAAQPRFHRVERINDVRYHDSESRDHLLDIYRPIDRPGPLPIVLYVHGGGFRILSKDSHWIMGLAFARHGFIVFNINYRLAPQHRFPAAIQDACRAARWVQDHAEGFGGDLDHVVFAGESAGANLVTSLAVASSYRRREPWAEEVFEAGPTPRAVIASCGLLQVTDIDRFHRRRPKKLTRFVRDRLQEVGHSYLGGLDRRPLSTPGYLDLADPLCFLERGEAPDRPLPPFFAPVGTKDPILDDSRRLKRALEQMGVACEAPIYPGEVHAFHAMIWRKQARDCWRDQFRFLRRHGLWPADRGFERGRNGR